MSFLLYGALCWVLCSITLSLLLGRGFGWIKRMDPEEKFSTPFVVVSNNKLRETVSAKYRKSA